MLSIMKDPIIIRPSKVKQEAAAARSIEPKSRCDLQGPNKTRFTIGSGSWMGTLAGSPIC